MCACMCVCVNDLPCSTPTSTRPSTPPTACFEYDPHHTVDPTSNSHYYKMILHSMISSCFEDRRIFEQSFRSLARAFFQVFGQFSKCFGGYSMCVMDFYIDNEQYEVCALIKELTSKV